MNLKMTQTHYKVHLCSLEPNWWLFTVSGLLSLMFGITALFMPFVTLLVSTLLFGAYAVVDGMLDIITGIHHAQRRRQWVGLIISGILGIAAGLVILITPHVASIILSSFLWWVIALWAMTTGFFEIVDGVRLRKEIRDGWLLVLSGILSVGAGIAMMILFTPETSLAMAALFIGANSIGSGIISLMLSYKLYRMKKGSPDGTDMIKPTKIYKYK